MSDAADVVPASAPIAAKSASGPPRRWAAVLLSLLAPGIGHMAIGHPRRAMGWYAALVVVFLSMLAGALSGVPVVLPFAALLGGALRVGAAIDTLRLRRPPDLLRARTVLLMAIGLFAFAQFVSGQIKARLIETFRIPSGSMYPTLEVGDYIFASKLVSRYAAGDVVVFDYPADPSVQYVKRIAAVAGERIEIRGGVLEVNGRVVPRTRTSLPCRIPETGVADPADGAPCTIWEEELAPGRRYPIVLDESRSAADFGPFVVPAGHVFVLGDNRDNSSDSRHWGALKTELLDGKVTGVWWSRGPGGVRWDRTNLRIR